MYPHETHQLSPDIGWIELWCTRCQANTVHDFDIVTDNEVQKNRAGQYVDTNTVRALRAVCSACNRRHEPLSEGADQ